MKLAGVIPLPGTALRDHELPGEASARRMLDFTTGRGVDAYVYEYGQGLDLVPIDSGDWFDSPGRR